MTINEVKYMVLDIKLEDQTLRIARMDYLKPEGICSPAFHSTTINREILDYSDGYENVTFMYDCPKSLHQKYKPCSISNGVKHKNWSVKAGDHDSGICDASVFFPVPKNWTAIIDDDPFLRQILSQGFELKLKKLRGISCENCNNSNGTCGWGPFSNETICFCPNQPNQPFGSTNACPGNDFELHGVIIEEEKELAKKMVLVSLWCIQTIPSDRPSITRVVEMLEGGLECLQVPPKPSLASQTRSPQHFSAIASSSSTA
ncbi:hypothetical protein LWI28_027822 [Acer negundo]|uniref:Wall-associated receptor kinase C-terminal domain-containing protein n=1 Tax=Acer negundo TaxID=4023 RepID=A0AAD5IKU4_ACENE|nr:hypothetical protein LWI28_027822 [Acer negundo]